MNSQAPKTGSAMASLQNLKAINSPLAKAKSVGGGNADLETINTWELMKDLNEQEDYSYVESYDPTLMTNRSGSTPPPLYKQMVRSTTSSSNGAFSVLIPRSKSLTSVQYAEDGKVFLAANKDAASMPAEPSLNAVMQEPNSININEAKDFSRLTLRKLFNKMYQGDLVSEDRGSPSDERPAQECLNVQRALSMKYILNDNTREDDQSHFSDMIDPTAFIDEAEGDGPATLSCESECGSALLSPQLSVTASLKDWLIPSESPSVTRTDSIGCDFFFEATEGSNILLAQQKTAYLLPNTRRVLSKYVGAADLESENQTG